MASRGEEDTSASKPFVSDEQGEKKAAVSFGFTKTVSKFKPSTVDAEIKKDYRDYLTGIDRNELQR